MRVFSNKLWLVLVVFVVLVAFGLYSRPVQQPELKTESQQKLVMQIGVVESLTGPAAFYGEQNRKGVEAAKAVLERRYPELELHVWHEDSQYTAQGGLSAYQKLKTEYGLDAVLTHASPVSLSLQPVVAEDGILQMATSASADSYSTPWDLSVRVSAKVGLESKVMAVKLCGLDDSSLVILAMNNEIGKSVADSLRQNLADLDCGVQVVGTELFDPVSADFRQVLGKYKNQANSNYYIAGLSANVATLLKQKSELDVSGSVFSFRTVEDPSFLPAAGGLAEGLVYTYAFDPNGTGEEVQEFVSTYESLFGEQPDMFAAEGYEGLMLAVRALRQCGKDVACLKTVFQAWGQVDSVFGKLSFDENGDVTYPFFLKTVRGGQFVRLEEEGQEDNNYNNDYDQRENP